MKITDKSSFESVNVFGTGASNAAFYAGWPKAWAAFRMAKEVWEK